jgi:hypothetical protein
MTCSQDRLWKNMALGCMDIFVLPSARAHNVVEQSVIYIQTEAVSWVWA